MILCWAAKGGSGTTVIACALALIAARRGPATVIDLAGDVPTALGGAAPQGPGIAEWLASPTADAASLASLATPMSDRLSVIARGSGPIGFGERVEQLVAAAQMLPQPIVDAGSCCPAPEWAGAASASLLVTRPCFLALHRAAVAPVRPTGVVLVTEPGRALRAGDVERALGAPVVATVALDPAVSRAVDAGMLLARLPQSLQRQLRALA